MRLAPCGASQIGPLSRADLDQKNSPSRLRFRPLNRLTFGFRLQSCGSVSIYLRSVLGASGNLWAAETSCKGSRDENLRSLRGRKIRPRGTCRKERRSALVRVGLAAAPEPHDSAERGQPGGDRLRRSPRAVGRHRLRLALRGDLARVPDRPAEDGVPLVDHSHVARVPAREPAHTKQDAAPERRPVERGSTRAKRRNGRSHPRSEEMPIGAKTYALPERPPSCGASAKNESSDSGSGTFASARRAARWARWLRANREQSSQPRRWVRS
jgi:hypothetical protein